MSLREVLEAARRSGRLAEPYHAFLETQCGAGFSILSSGGGGVAGDIAVNVSRGSDNVVCRGYKSTAAHSKIIISGSGNIILLGPHSRFSMGDVRITGDNCVFYFGAFSTVESMIIMLNGPGGRIEIGDFCMLSARIIIDRSDHHSIYDLATGQRTNHDGDVLINDHVWIGRDVRVNKGVRIGKDSIVGQASVVAGDLQGNTVFGGVPARPIREGVTWSRMKAESLGEMEATMQHQEFLLQVDLLRQRCDSHSPRENV